MPSQTISINEIEKIFGVLDALGVSREAVVIPLTPKHPGSVRELPNAKLEIVVDSEEPFDAWLAGLEGLIRKATGG